jgi:hypothetical protein
LFEGFRLILFEKLLSLTKNPVFKFGTKKMVTATTNQNRSSWSFDKNLNLTFLPSFQNAVGTIIANLCAAN